MAEITPVEVARAMRAESEIAEALRLLRLARGLLRSAGAGRAADRAASAVASAEGAARHAVHARMRPGMRRQSPARRAEARTA
jgi:hypothetical protein